MNPWQAKLSQDEDNRVITFPDGTVVRSSAIQCVNATKMWVSASRSNEQTISLNPHHPVDDAFAQKQGWVKINSISGGEKCVDYINPANIAGMQITPDAEHDKDCIMHLIFKNGPYDGDIVLYSVNKENAESLQQQWKRVATDVVDFPDGASVLASEIVNVEQARSKEDGARQISQWILDINGAEGFYLNCPDLAKIEKLCGQLGFVDPYTRQEKNGSNIRPVFINPAFIRNVAFGPLDEVAIDLLGDNARMAISGDVKNYESVIRQWKQALAAHVGHSGAA